MKSHTAKICYHKKRTNKPYQLQIDGKSCGYYQTREEAERIRDNVLIELGGEQKEKRTKEKTLLSIAEEFFLSRNKQGYKVSYEPIFANWISPHVIAQMPLKNIQARDIQAFVNWLETQTALPGNLNRKPEKKLSIQTIKHIKNALSAMLAYAAKAGMIPVNPAATIKVEYAKQKGKLHGNALTKEEIEALLTHPKIDAHRKDYYAFAIYSGLRTGEINTLRISDVNLNDETLGPHVWVTSSRWRAGKREELPKTNAGYRRVPLLPKAKQAIENQLLRLRFQPNPQGLVFPQKDGTPVKHCYPAMVFNRHIEWINAIGVRPGCKLTPHSLRHTCATGLLSGWFGKRFSLEEAQSWMGHTSTATTLIYAHYGDSLALSGARELTLNGQVGALNGQAG